MREHLTFDLNNKKIVEVPLITIDGPDINPRTHLNGENVAQLMETPSFPEVHLGYHEGKLYVVDGYHRLEATRRLGNETIAAFIVEYTDINEMRRKAFTLNVNHGQRLSDFEVIQFLYLEAKRRHANNMVFSVKELLKEFQVPDRKGRVLFNWIVINRELLEKEDRIVNNLSNYEVLNGLIVHSKETMFNFSEEFKTSFKLFFNKYGNRPREVIIKARDLWKDGKDFDEEMEKQEQERIRLEQEEEERRLSAMTQTTVLDDSDDEDDDIDYDSKMEKVTFPGVDQKQIGESRVPNDVDRVKVERISQPVATTMVMTDNKKENGKNFVKNTTQTIHSAILGFRTGKIEFTQSSFNELNCLVDSICEFIALIDPITLEQDEEKNGI